jgi:CheY-like chemotaxis protein
VPTRRAVTLPLVEPIVPVLRDQPFDDPAYLFEPKYDGFRGLLYLSGRECHFRSKRGNMLKQFAELCDWVRHELRVKEVILDGERTRRWTQLRRTQVRIDAVLADVVMPNMTGTELLALVLANRPELPIALMSGFSAEALRARGLEEPPVPLLTKPFTQEQLVALLERLSPLGTSSSSA